MKYRIIILLIALLAWGSARGEPATQPSPRKILLLPFAPVDDVRIDASVSRGVQRSLQADLGKSALLQLITIRLDAGIPVGGYDSAYVRRQAKSENADFVIHGTYQLNGRELRLAGLVVVCATEQSIGSLKSTANLNDLFDMEDTISHQALRLLIPPQPRSEFTPACAEDQKKVAVEEPYRNFYAWNDQDPAEARSRQTLQTQIDYVEPFFYGNFGGYGSYSGYGFGGRFTWRRLGYYP